MAHSHRHRGNEKAPGQGGSQSVQAHLILPGVLGCSALRPPHLPRSPLEHIAEMTGDVIDRYPACPPSISRVVDVLTQEHDRWLQEVR
jgi:hypothetical protein